MKRELWYFLIKGEADNETGLFGNFYSYGQHLGAALENAFREGKSERFNNPDLFQASKLSDFEDIDNKDELVQLSDSVYMRQEVYSFPSNDPEKDFTSPIGIVNSVEESEYDYELIKESFVAYGRNEKEFFELELVVGKEKLAEVLLELINCLPTIDGCWIYIQNHWDNQETELWLAKHFLHKNQVSNFLVNHRSDTIENGYLKIVVHSLVGETNLTLDDHKKIQLHTKDESLFREFIGKAIDLGYNQTRDFYNLEVGYYHWHYRKADSLDREGFIQLLQNNDFDLVDKWKE
jgi:hypothetical protein